MLLKSVVTAERYGETRRQGENRQADEVQRAMSNTEHVKRRVWRRMAQPKPTRLTQVLSRFAIIRDAKEKATLVTQRADRPYPSKPRSHPSK